MNDSTTCCSPGRTTRCRPPSIPAGCSPSRSRRSRVNSTAASAPFSSTPTTGCPPSSRMPGANTPVVLTDRAAELAAATRCRLRSGDRGARRPAGGAGTGEGGRHAPDLPLPQLLRDGCGVLRQRAGRHQALHGHQARRSRHAHHPGRHHASRHGRRHRQSGPGRPGRHARHRRAAADPRRADRLEPAAVDLRRRGWNRRPAVVPQRVRPVVPGNHLRVQEHRGLQLHTQSRAARRAALPRQPLGGGIAAGRRQGARRPTTPTSCAGASNGARSSAASCRTWSRPTSRSAGGVANTVREFASQLLDRARGADAANGRAGHDDDGRAAGHHDGAARAGGPHPPERRDHLAHRRRPGAVLRRHRHRATRARRLALRRPHRDHRSSRASPIWCTARRW